MVFPKKNLKTGAVSLDLTAAYAYNTVWLTGLLAKFERAVELLL